MIFGNDRRELRQMYRDAWDKLQKGTPLTPLEAQIAAVVAEHPEYHQTVASAADTEFRPDDGRENPFLHMGLHLAIRDQVKTNRPTGIASIHQRLSARAGDAHTAEHGMMEALAEALWAAQRANSAPNEDAYMERLRKLP